MYTAIYARVSSSLQETKSQETDLLAYKSACEGKGEQVRMFREKKSGTNYDRAEWQKIWADVQAGKVQRIVVWRLDRLGRLAGQTIQLMDDLEAKGVAFLSLRDGFDPSTPAGRLTRNVLASVAQFETEVRSERQRAGIDAVRKAHGGKCPWGGPHREGKLNKSTLAKLETVRRLKAEGRSITEIANVVGLTRQTIYRILDNGKVEK
jgi:DNA invertase Pin-like site-specific DNA recombinase